MKAFRTLLALGVIALALFLVLPGLLGGQIEEETVAYFEATKNVSGDVDYTIDYDRGWFSSQLTLNIEYSPQIAAVLIEKAEDDAAPSPRMVFKISHGPLLWTGPGPKLGLASISGENPFFGLPESRLKGPLKAFPRLKTFGVIGFAGNVTVGISAPAFEIVTATANADASPTSDLAIRVHPIRVVTDFSRDGSLANLKLRPASIKVEIAGGQDEPVIFEVHNILFDNYYEATRRYPLNFERGRGSLEALSVSFKGEGAERARFVVNDAKYVDYMIRRENNSLFDYAGEFTAGKSGILKGDETEPQVSSLNVKSEFLNLNGEALLAVIEEAQDLPAEPSQVQNEEILNGLAKALSYGFEHRVTSLRAATKWGQVRYSHRLAFPHLDDENMASFQGLMQGMEFRGEFYFDRGFVESMIALTLEAQLESQGLQVDEATRQSLTANTLNQFIQAGFLVPEDGGLYSAVIEYKDGVATINGQTSDLLKLPEGVL